MTDESSDAAEMKPAADVAEADEEGEEEEEEAPGASSKAKAKRKKKKKKGGGATEDAEADKVESAADLPAATETEPASADAAEDDDDEDDAAPSASAKKKKKKKKKPASGGAVGSKPAPSLGVLGFTDSYVRHGQTDPPSKPVRYPRPQDTRVCHSFLKQFRAPASLRCRACSRPARSRRAKSSNSPVSSTRIA